MISAKSMSFSESVRWDALWTAISVTVPAGCCARIRKMGRKMILQNGILKTFLGIRSFPFLTDRHITQRSRLFDAALPHNDR